MVQEGNTMIFNDKNIRQRAMIAQHLKEMLEKEKTERHALYMPSRLLKLKGPDQASFCFRISCTWAGLALPLEAFIT